MLNTVDDNHIVAVDTLIERARGLGTILRERATSIEKDRTVSPEAIEEIRRRDIFRILQPRIFGGFEHDWDAMMSVGLEIAAACGSTGWVACLGIGHQWFVSKFPIEAQHDVWDDDPDALTFGSYAPSALAEKVDGGYRVSGRWRFASGCDHGAWGLLGLMLPAKDGEDGPRHGFSLVPRSDYVIDDDWHAMGLVGTGSKSIVCDDVFIPAHRILDFDSAIRGNTTGAAFHDNPLYRLPLFTCIPLNICVPPLGILHGAIEQFREDMQHRSSRGAITTGGKTVADYAAVQTHFAEATASLDAACLLIRRDIAEAHRVIKNQDGLSTDMRIRNRRDQAYAVRLATNGINGLFDAGGALGIFLDNHVQRAWRDINAAARHIAFSWGAVSAMYGQNAFGRPVMPPIPH
jgi:alkylation response protein AidB-like acyl-CoA dehydrogenase